MLDSLLKEFNGTKNINEVKVSIAITGWFLANDYMSSHDSIYDRCKEILECKEGFYLLCRESEDETAKFSVKVDPNKFNIKWLENNKINHEKKFKDVNELIDYINSSSEDDIIKYFN